MTIRTKKALSLLYALLGLIVTVALASMPFLLFLSIMGLGLAGCGEVCPERDNADTIIVVSMIAIALLGLIMSASILVATWPRTLRNESK